MAKNILYVSVSPFGEKSFSRRFAKELIGKIETQHPGSTVIERDLNANPLPHLTGDYIAAMMMPDDKRSAEQHALLKPSDEAIAEVMAADVIVIASPMWNLGVPSVVKAWIDHLMRARVTFRYTATGAEGLIPSDKKVVIASARGGIYSEGPAASMDHQESYLRTALGFMGLTDVSVIRAEGLNMGEESQKKAVNVAQAMLGDVLKHVA